MDEYVVYSKNGCVWCDRMRELLIQKHVTFTEVKIDESAENFAELMRLYPEAKTVPQLFHGENRIGGYNEAKMHLADTYGSFGDDV